MQTRLADFIRETPEGREADAILRACVHCGFCTATCPTYQLLGDELDGPRGRIYLIKQMLEGADVTASTQLHLDRCLTCRSCETTCPSGVRYGRLADMGRQVVQKKGGCGVVVKDYAYLLRDDAEYSEKAKRVSELARDPVAVIAAEWKRLAPMVAMDHGPQRVAFQSPCTLQHGLQLAGRVEEILAAI